MRPARPNDLLRDCKVPALLSTNLVNIRYLTGLELSLGALLVSPRHITLFVDGRYLEMAEKKVRSGIYIRPRTQLAAALKRLDACCFEADEITVSGLKRLKAKCKGVKFYPSSGVIEECRRSKEADEIRLFRKAQSITQEIIKRIPKHLKPGISEKEFAWTLRSWAIEAGADDLSFDPIVAFGTHTSSPHHHPTDRKLKKNQIVQIDVGARYKGYCADQSAVFFTGKPTAKQQRVYDAVAAAQQVAVDIIQPGVTTHELDKAARSVLKREKLNKYFVHSLGHGVGLEIHEGVSLSQKIPSEELQKGEIVTIEPGVYIPGEFGIRLETEVVV